MSIAALILWAFTAGAGIYLLMAVNAAKRRAGDPAGVGAAATGEPEAARAAATLRVPQAADAATGSATETRPAPAVPAATAGPPGTVMTPHITHTRVTAGPDDHPLLEFTHPALGLAGLGGWFAFTFTHYRGFAWFAFGALVIGIGAGLTWLAGNARAGNRRRAADVEEADRDRRRVPRHLIVLHGLAAATTLTLAAIATFVVLT